MVLANVKQSISGTYHAIKQAKYACRYLDEAVYQFNRRFRLPELLPRLLRAIVHLNCTQAPLSFARVHRL